MNVKTPTAAGMWIKSMPSQVVHKNSFIALRHFFLICNGETRDEKYAIRAS